MRAEAVVIRGGDVDDVASPGVREDRRVARNRRRSCVADQGRCSPVAEVLHPTPNRCHWSLSHRAPLSGGRKRSLPCAPGPRHSAQLPSLPATRLNAPWPAAWCSCSSTAFLLQLGRITSRHGGIRQAGLRPLSTSGEHQRSNATVAVSIADRSPGRPSGLLRLRHGTTDPLRPGRRRACRRAD